VFTSHHPLTPRQAEELRAAWLEARKTQPIRAVIENDHGVPSVIEVDDSRWRRWRARFKPGFSG
jgi:hypothetical protein